jgi:hypothetical protein
LCFESCHKYSFWHFASFSKTVNISTKLKHQGFRGALSSSIPGHVLELKFGIVHEGGSVIGARSRAGLLLPSSQRSHASSCITPHENIKLPVPRAPYCRIHVEMLSISAAQVNRAIVTGRAPIIAAPLMAERSKSSAIVPSPTATQARTAA